MILTKLNFQLNIVIPDTREVPLSIENILSQTDHYIAKDLSLIEFIRKPFIEAFIKRGKFIIFAQLDEKFYLRNINTNQKILFTGRFYALSVNTRIDVDDCIGISSDGILQLSVTKDVYHYLGLIGKLSKTAKQYSNRYSKSTKNQKQKKYFQSSLLLQQLKKCLNKNV